MQKNFEANNITFLKSGTKTRWQTYTVMIEDIMEKELFLRRNYSELTLNSEEMETFLKYAPILIQLSLASVNFEPNDVTIHLVFPKLIEIYNSIPTLGIKEEERGKIKNVFEKYFPFVAEPDKNKEQAEIYIVGTFLDPKNKSFSFLPEATKKSVQEFCKTIIRKYQNIISPNRKQTVELVPEPQSALQKMRSKYSNQLFPQNSSKELTIDEEMEMYLNEDESMSNILFY